MRQRVVVAGLVVVLVAVLGLAFWLPGRGRPGLGGGAGGSVGIVAIEGVISDGSSSGGLLGAVVGARTVVEQLRQAEEDGNVKAVVLRLNSPGGSAAASQEIARAVQRLREAGKPVVASMGDTAASGAYWVASAADKIVADPATITGSIGVIIQVQNLQELYDKLGIDSQVIKSGPHKDMGSGNRPLTSAEKDIFQGMVDDIYDQFVEAVAAGRGLSRQEVARLADGRVYTGRQARQLGLVDTLGDYREALSLAASLAGLPEPPAVKTFTRPSPWSFILSQIQSAPYHLRLPAFQPDYWLLAPAIEPAQ
ncbi:MAG: signal peptide peptidase SppA [Clostridia bacterium]|nr:MAG: signal peptide peptidase SppA [Clostridia bacterium]